MPDQNDLPCMLRDPFDLTCLVSTADPNHETGLFPTFSKQSQICPTFCHSYWVASLSLLSNHRLAFPHSRMAQDRLNMPPPAFIPPWDTGFRDEPQYKTPGSHPIYELRKGVRTSGKMAPSAWLDQDSSGDYEPELSDFRKPRARRAKRPRTDCSLDSTSESTPKKLKKANYQRGSDSWPFKSDTVNSTPESLLDDDAGSPSTDSSPITPVRYQLRKHGGGAHQHNEVSTFSEITPDDPAARSCKSCFAHGLPCSLLKEGSRYPCEFCVADGEDCELIIEPLQKQSCLNCKKRRIPCSFKIEPDRRGPCNSCISSSTGCVAGPLNRRSIVRPQRQRQAAIPTIRAGRGLLSRSITPRPYGHQSHLTQAMEVGSATSHDQVIPYEDAPNNSPPGVIQTIATCYAHPISFNYESMTMLEPITCHWCDDSLYGLVGLGPVEAEVIDYRNGQGYTEIEHGHTCAGHFPSRMCTACTLARLLIAACICHEVEPILGVDPEAYTVASFTHYLVRGMTDFAPFDWCSICPTPASYHCSKPQEPNMLSDDPKYGCGLLLCERCAAHLMGRYSGVLERLMDALKLRDGGFALRADAEFLHPKGELLRRYDYAGGLS